MGRHGGVAMFEDRNANLWWSSGRSFGSNLSLEKMEPGGKLHTVVISPSFGARGPEPVQVNFFSEDSEGILWLGTETGLVRLDPRTERYSTYTTREGLPDNVIQCILPDQSGNLWISTGKGLAVFNPRENSFYNYHQSDGLQGEQFNRKSCYQDGEGRMYFGGLHGFNAFDPREILARRPSPPGSGAD